MIYLGFLYHCDISREIVQYLYTRRMEEGYDLPDSRYDQWLECYHPEECEFLINISYQICIAEISDYDGFLDSPTNTLDILMSTKVRT